MPKPAHAPIVVTPILRNLAAIAIHLDYLNKKIIVFYQKNWKF